MLLLSILHLQFVPSKPTPQHVPKLFGAYIPTSYSVYMHTYMNGNYPSGKSKSIIPVLLQAFSRGGQESLCLLAEPVIN